MKLMKATLRRLWRLTRATSTVVGLAVMVALVAGVASLAVAAPSGTTTATAILKGVSNTATAVTTLVNTGTGAALSLEAKSGNPALSLPAQTGTAPLAVNSETKVDHLNADKLDNLDSGAFLGANATATNATNADNADNLDHRDSTDFLAANGKAVDSSHADQADQAGQATSATNAANADKLDNMDSSAFAAKAEAPGADATHVNQVSIGGTGAWQNVVSVTVTAPADGFVIVTASGSFTKNGFSQHVEGTPDYFAAALTSVSGDIDADSVQFWNVGGALHTGDYSGPFSTTKMYPVTAGNKTFSLMAEQTNNLGVNGLITNANITAYYVKNRF